ncbi:hypothetical protein GMD78_13075 [Ornithinibacillus sp. L9]|uniref:Restriction endonuclease type IV Mrr domain-containing protein n=1 Tax=Ornithinibacillus caprae TaxID=2678566 RepID=A0A6N8FLQ7_9BACI|nr:restriction endonuclease [Ornithinibacillus caprae]MUK89304.1 hypothetical protein [Ornithinibacillus caprae]
MNFGIEIPRIENEEMFEKLCLDLVKQTGQYENVNRNGRRGQRQDGVDIFARIKQSSEWIGIQCKVKKNGSIKEEEIKNEIKKAYGFNPNLSHYIFYTTAERDSKIQAYVRSLSDENINKNLFNVDILFWEDIEDLLREDKYNSVHYKYYRDFYTQIEDDGFAFGKLISLNIGHRQLDSVYPLLIGKTYRKDTKKNKNINYWKGVYFIVNFNERTSETFPIPCFPTDLEEVFQFRRDRYIISKFINTIPNIDKFIKSEESNYELLLTDKEYEEFLKLYRGV